MLKCKNLTKTYVSGKSDIVKAIDETNIELNDNNLVFIVGPSGSGKTTLMNVLCGLDEADSGSILMDEKELTLFSQGEFDEFRRKNVGIVFQNFNLMDEYNVFDNIALPLKLLGVRKDKIKLCVADVLKAVNLSGYEKRKTTELSAGQKQRIAIARAIVKKPGILFLDEPTGNLDAYNSKAVFELVKRISRSCLVIVVSHDVKNAEKFADKIVHIQDGKIASIKNRVAKYMKVTSLSIRNTKNNIVYTAKEGDEVFEFISQMIEDNDKDEGIYLNLEVDAEYDRIDFETTIEGAISDFEVDDRVKGLHFKDKLKSSMSNYKTRKVRLLITFLLFIFTSLYTLVMFSFSVYDSKTSLENYLDEQKINEVMVYKSSSYKNIFGETEMLDTNVGENFYQSVSRVVENKDIEKIITLDELSSGVGEDDFMDVSARVYDGDGNEKTLLFGEYPKKQNEIVLSDYLAELLFPGNSKESLVGKKVSNIDDTFTVSGIVDSGYGSETKITDRSMLMNQYGYAVLGETYIQHLKSQMVIKLEGCDITQSNSLSAYADSSANYCSCNDISQDMLLCGHMPEAENEILVSNYVADQIDLDYEKDFHEMDYALINLHDKQYAGTYDLINLYDFIKEHNVKIVGVFQGDKNTELSYADLSIDDDVFQRLKERYLDYYYYQNIIVKIQNARSLINGFEKEGIQIGEEGCQKIYLFHELVKSIRKFIYVLFMIAMAIYLFFLITYVYYAISDRARQIGIMRSLGIPRKDIKSIFSVNVIVLSLATIPFAVFAFSRMINYVNVVFDKRHLQGIGFKIMPVNMISVALLELFFVILSYIFALIPIVKMSKHTPVDLLNK